MSLCDFPTRFLFLKNINNFTDLWLIQPDGFRTAETTVVSDSNQLCCYLCWVPPAEGTDRTQAPLPEAHYQHKRGVTN